jgi:hypothetical protein
MVTAYTEIPEEESQEERPGVWANGRPAQADTAMSICIKICPDAKFQS